MNKELSLNSTAAKREQIGCEDEMSADLNKHQDE